MAGPGWAELSADDVLLQLRINPGATSAFLDTHQWSPLQKTAGCMIAGGHPQAQLRRVAMVHEPRVSCWRIERSDLPPEATSARALRAYMYRSGIADGSLGDIVIGDHAALASTPETDIADVIPGAVLAEGWDEPEVSLERATVSALRIDAVIAPLFRVSRGEAQTALQYAFVFQNFAPATKRTLAVAKGDQLVFRTKGRIEIVECDATTKSGRVAVSFRRFPI